ncbi:MAG: hypothetical protein FWE95_07255 [Planctomycetaceae bacterium]|nr:hypothetical protein [Planctomycetaceae bacterium]
MSALKYEDDIVIVESYHFAVKMDVVHRTMNPSHHENDSNNPVTPLRCVPGFHGVSVRCFFR